MRTACLLITAALSGCADETLSGYAGPRDWTLAQIDGVPFTSTATLSLAETGRVSGRGPCNEYGAPQTAPYPWFELGRIAVTRRACPDLAAEREFLDALTSMTLSEVSGDILILSNDDGRSMTFVAQD